MRAAGALALLGLAAGAAALEPTKVSLKQTCTGQGWKVDFPATVYPNTPQFNFTVSTDNFQAAGDSSFEASGSLGLANHPLGIFKFKADGSACGTQVAYVKDGVLGQVTMFYPPCPWATNGPLTLTFRVDIWTVLPAIPPLIGTGYEADVKLLNGGKELLCLKVDLAQPAKSGADKSQDKCGISTSDIPSYPPAADMHIPYVTVSLDDAPEHRWDAIVTPRKEAILTLINGFIDNISPRINSTIVRLILDGTAEKDLKRMPADYAAEMRGIAKATGVKVGFIWMMNMMYELTGFCTSVVAQDTDGHIMHGRNLDFGIFMGTNATTHSWQLTQNLRNILLNVGFTKGGKTVYNATTYAGFVGLLSGSRGPVGSVEGFSATVDTRYDSSLDKGIIEWILGKNDDCQFLTFATRIAMETKTTYADALAYLTTYKPLGPAYIIIGGAAPGQGAIIALAFGQKQPVDVWHLKDALAQGSFYILETNYDRLKAPPGFDDRRYPAEDCLNTVVKQDGLTYAALWKVMSANPTRNALTTFTTLMSPSTGHFEAYQQNCAPGPHCVPF